MGVGTRRSETLAVRWSDLNLDTGRLRINRSLQSVDGTLRDDLEPKTERARREVTLPTFALERLRSHRRSQAERRLRLGAEWHDRDLICDRGDGEWLHPDSWSTAFRRLADSTDGIPAGIRLYDVRHAVARMMLAQGVHPGIASAVLGHADPAFTMRTYQHVLDGMTDQAADAIARARGG
jgi:integrase